METVAIKQKASLEITINKDDIGKAVTDVVKKGVADIFLNTDIFIAAERPWHLKFVNTFETDGFCAIVPYSLNSKFDFIYKPFDLWTWILFLISMLGGATVWHFLNKRSQAKSNSFGFFIFAFISNFLGQGVTFRKHRPMQKLILQLSVATTFVLGTVYQSLVISSMYDSRFNTKITTVDELINSDYSFYIIKMFQTEMNASYAYQKMRPKIVVIFDGLQLFFFDFISLSEKNIAIVETCSLLDEILTNGKQHFGYNLPNQFYYKLDGKFSSFYLKFPIAMKTFFHQKLQKLSLRIFESGIKKSWTIPNNDDPILTEESVKMTQTIPIEFVPALRLIAVGLVFSFLIFLIEKLVKILSTQNLSRFMLRKLRICKKNLVFKQKRVNHNVIEIQPGNLKI